VQAYLGLQLGKKLEHPTQLPEEARQEACPGSCGICLRPGASAHFHNSFKFAMEGCKGESSVSSGLHVPVKLGGSPLWSVGGHGLSSALKEPAQGRASEEGDLLLTLLSNFEGSAHPVPVVGPRHASTTSQLPFSSKPYRCEWRGKAQGHTQVQQLRA
jgi:hypothetical protein